MYTAPIVLGSDHAGFALKEKIKQYLRGLEIEVEDLGAFSETSVNYAEYGRPVASRVSNGDFKRGILICGSGIGMSMVANRFPHVRAALCQDVLSAKLSRLHNNANILVMGGRLVGETLAEEIVKTWLETPFEGGRHLERLNSFDRI